MAAEVVVVAAVVIVEHRAAGGGPVGRGNRRQGEGGALGAETAGDALGGFGQTDGILLAVDRHQVGHPPFQGALHLQGRGGLHLAPETSREAAAAHLGAFGLQPDLRGSCQGRQIGGEQVFVVLAAGLGRQAQGSEAAATVVGPTLQIHHRHAPSAEGQQQVGLAGAGAAPQQTQGPGPLEQGEHPAAVGLIAPVQQQDRQVELAGQPGHRPRTHATAPTVEAQGDGGEGGGEGGGGRRRLGEGRGQRAHFRPNHGQPPQHRRLAALLFVEGADFGPFGIREQGQVGGAGDVALGEFAGAAHIQHGTGAGQKGRAIEGGLRWRWRRGAHGGMVREKDSHGEGTRHDAQGGSGTLWWSK